jgi:hypothetical protein
LAQKFPIFYRQALYDLGRKWRKIVSAEWKSGSPAGQTLVPLADITGILKRQRQSVTRAKLQTFQSARKRRLREIRTNLLTGAQRNYGTFTSRIQRLKRQMEVQEGHGGKLTSAVGFNASNEGLKVGLLQSLDLLTWGESYQSGDTRPFTRAERRMLHSRLASRSIPMQYKKPIRSVIAPHEFAWNKDAEATVRKSLLARVEAAKAKQTALFFTPKTGTTL